MNPLTLNKEDYEIWAEGFSFGCLDSAYRNQLKTIELEHKIESLELSLAHFRRTFNSWPYRGGVN